MLIPLEGADSVIVEQVAGFFGADARPREVRGKKSTTVTLKWTRVADCRKHIVPWLWRRRVKLLSRRLHMQVWVCIVLLLAARLHLAQDGENLVRYLHYLRGLESPG